MRDFAQVKYNGVITETVAHTALDLMDVDTLGLDRVDRNILVTIIESLAAVRSDWTRWQRRSERMPVRSRMFMNRIF